MIAAGLKHARRFKQVSLPVLWDLCQAKANSAIEGRAGKHALKVLREVYEVSADRDDLRKRLEQIGEKALAAHLAEASVK